MAVPLLPLAIGLSAVSGVIGAVGAVRSAQAQSAAADYNAQVMAQNASIASAQGSAAAGLQWQNAQRRIGASIAAFGGSGVQGSTGSPTDVLADNIQSATLDNLTTQYNYKLRALGYSDQAGLDRANASNSSTAGYLAGAGQLIGAAGQAAYLANSKGGGYSIPGYGGSQYPFTMPSGQMS